jgi:opacity protein-like surface antigen
VNTRALVGLVVVLSIGLAVPAAAQDKAAAASGGGRSISWNIAGGVAKPLGQTGDAFQTGGLVDFGMTYRLAGNLGLQFDYEFIGLGAVPQEPLQTPSGGQIQFSLNGRAQLGAFDLVFMPASSGRFSAYVLGGGGIYRRTVDLTTPGQGQVIVCNPEWFVCYPGAVPVDQVIGSRASTGFGVNFGGGVNIKVNDRVAFYVEGRYHYVWGPSFETPSGSKKANGQILPFVFGFRF